jgi:hypothetical protein
VTRGGAFAPEDRRPAGGGAAAGRVGAVAPWALAAMAVATVAYGLYEDAHGRLLGVPHPPFIGAYGIRATWWILPTVPAFAAAVALVPTLLRLKALRFAAALFLGTLALRVLLGLVRMGTFGLHDMFDVLPRGEGKNEYLPSLPAFAYGTRFFLDRFAELVPALPVHSAGHPPGLLVVMHWFQIDTANRLAALCIVVGALSAPLTYVLARQLFQERTAQIAGLLAALAPSMLHFGATSADAVFLTLGLLAAIGLLKRPAVGAIILAVVTLFAWSLLAVAAWAAILVALRDGWRPALRLAIYTGVATLAFHGALAAATGWDPIGTLKATAQVYEVGIASRRPYSYWLFGSPTAFLLILGAPIAWLAARRLPQPEATAIFAVILVSALGGFTKAETERIWLFLVPFVCLAAAPLVKRPTLIAAALATQAVVYEVVFDTLW